MIESSQRIEPCGIEEIIPEALTDLVRSIREESAEIGRVVRPESIRELRMLMRLMNACYSNLIEGQNTRPRDTEAAPRGAKLDEERHPLAEEAAAHVRVQAWLDELADRDELPQPATVSFMCELHRRFYEAMPSEFRFLE